MLTGCGAAPRLPGPRAGAPAGRPALAEWGLVHHEAHRGTFLQPKAPPARTQRGLYPSLAREAAKRVFPRQEGDVWPWCCLVRLRGCPGSRTLKEPNLA